MALPGGNPRREADEAIVEAAAELLIESYCHGPKFGRNTAHMIAERRRQAGRPTDTPYRCPAGADHYHIGPTPIPAELVRLARALRGLDPDQPGNTTTA